MLLEPDRVPDWTDFGPSQSDVASLPHTAEWLAYHRLVLDECRGCAPEGTTERLSRDPFRWAAHLGCAAGEITEQLKSRPPSEDIRWRSAAARARQHILARKAEVVALRKRHALHLEAVRAHERICSLTATVREIAEIAELAGPDSLSRVLDRARAATREETT